MTSPEPTAKTLASGLSGHARHQLRRASTARHILSGILGGMHRIDPKMFWATALSGVAARFAVLGQFVIVLRALFDALEGALSPARIGLYAALILVASMVRLIRLRLQRIYVSQLCREAVGRFRRDAGGRKAYQKLKATAYAKTTRGFSIVEALLFAATTGLGLVWISAALAALLFALCAILFLVLVFFDMYRAKQVQRGRFAAHHRPLESLVRTDMAFNLALLIIAVFVQSRGDIALDGLLALALVFTLRYLIVYMRQLQRSVVYLLDLAAKQDTFIAYFATAKRT